ncbi:MAG: hypothetical protein GF355_07395 [Candidatus Eisenbacteria bacterium]|nr:hypothetical protein [Candidatus Eisenbacteria bacterium]
MWRLGCLLAAVVLVVIVLLGPGLLESYARWLAAGEEPAPADAILVLGGGRGERLATAVELYHEGWARRMFLIGPGEPYVPRSFDEEALSQSEIKRLIAVKRGVAADSVQVILGASSTYEEAQLSLEIMRKTGVERLLVVTSPFHARRARQTFRHVYNDEEIAARVIRTSWDTSTSDPEKWWWRESDTLSVFNETFKLIYYLIRYGIWPL